jgi:hypothetical protein
MKKDIAFAEEVPCLGEDWFGNILVDVPSR